MSDDLILLGEQFLTSFLGLIGLLFICIGLCGLLTTIRWHVLLGSILFMLAGAGCLYSICVW